MDVNLQRKIDQMAGPFLCRLLSLFPRKTGTDPDKFRPNRILIILLSEMGALVLAQPMIRRIKEKYPEASLYILLFRQNREVLELFDEFPSENILAISNRSFFSFVSDSIKAILKLRQIRIDTVIDCELFSRISSLFSVLSGASVRVGFHPHTQEGLYRGGFINRPVLYNPYVHMAQQFITLAEAPESDGVPLVKRKIPEKNPILPGINAARQEIMAMAKRFNTDFPGIKDKKPVLIYPGGGLLPIRAWPLEYYCQITMDLIRSGYNVGIIGLRQDKSVAEKIQSVCSSDRCIDLTGYTKSVREIILLFHMASLLISNDGGPVHFAALTPIPIITFFGPETPSLYGPLSPNAFNFHTGLACSPCLTAYNHRNSPCDGDNLCLKLIKPEQVLAKAYEMLQNQETLR